MPDFPVISAGNLGYYVPTGGTIGQLLQKVSDANGDIAWVTPSEEFNDHLRYTFACEETLAVGDLVYPDITIPGHVITSEDNRLGIPCIGIATQKYSDTSALVYFGGLCPIDIPDLVAGNLVFIGVDGAPKTTKPANGWFQTLGFCHENNKLFLNINFNIVRLNPF